MPSNFETSITNLQRSYNSLWSIQKLFIPSALRKALTADLSTIDKATEFQRLIADNPIWVPKWFFFNFYNELMIVFSLELKLDSHQPKNLILDEQVDMAVDVPNRPINIDTVFDDVFANIAAYLPPEDLINLSAACKATFFKSAPSLLSKKAMHLGTLVAQGQQDKAETLLAAPVNVQKLLLKPAIITDYPDRTFYCTAYEYAYWAKDKHMCRMLEKKMDAETKASMLSRVEAIEKHGLQYTQHGKTYCSNHFDFEPLIRALATCVNGVDNWTNLSNWGAITSSLMSVGLAQREVPAHVMNEYCRTDRSFDPLPLFNEKELPRILNFMDSLFDHQTLIGHLTKIVSVFPLEISESAGLGVDFALVRGPFYRPDAVKVICSWNSVGARDVWCKAVFDDLAAIIRLDEVRTADLTQSRENLRSVEPEHHVGMTY